MEQPRDSHWNALKHTLNYVHSTCGQGKILNATDELTLQAFSDSGWGSCLNSRRSVTCYVLLLGKSSISWKSKKQGTVSRSSSEAKYRAMVAAATNSWINNSYEEDFFTLSPTVCKRLIWIYFLKHKSEVFKVFVDFYHMICTQFQTPIRILRTDNGREYVNTEMHQFFTSKGIIHQTSCPDTPNKMVSLNGKTEPY
ncbi:uncharacterized mitochondrial protein AtMg00810-like [Amaranthus tricolor]|uniref:uncharacterized mitochondrial protein AtMg00810-like n=1 Tax=Amaranthus tricolor TaxID=29722 RepID=UPI00258459E5|nr:uncharacterized mitochondrial protein AtMg00810-like [Amaranthus tricolor]